MVMIAMWTIVMIAGRVDDSDDCCVDDSDDCNMDDSDDCW